MTKQVDHTPPGTDPDRPVDRIVHRLVGYKLKISYLTVRHAAQQALEPLGLRIVSMTALSLIVDNPGIAPSRIADDLQMERSNIVGIIDELEAQKLISRSRSRQDLRRFALTATVRGRRLRDRAVAEVEKAEDIALHALSSDEKSVLLELLSRIQKTPG
ncbi:DNA-binding transcriptional regulator, MarR family [Paracoccus isoporae]|uniref:DNA-binding transcriptional regulator, MarR family n=1 Tax=Paracoccus isoporae TaxID=591205 RepID=A0A1G6U135_9RHOB|nr:MarR family transcriptional regulator [Paracoccus isoporae]SDD34894.1 DNA-binding transcriptional regulator, MarR family [Paracoccus isoporae]